jgi:hypothetical protein
VASAQAVWLYKQSTSGWQIVRNFPGYSRGIIDGTRLALSGKARAADGIEREVVSIYDLVADQWSLTSHIFSENTFDTNFGYALALSGNQLVIGAFADASVSIYRFQNNMWVKTQRIVSPDPARLSYFGKSLTLTEKGLAIAAPYAENYRGAVYLYQKQANQWVLFQTISQAQNKPWQGFASNVVMNDSYLAISETDYRAPGITGGAVLIYETSASGWIFKDLITAPDSSDSLQFGHSLAIEGDSLLVGSPAFRNDHAPYGGCVYLFQRQNGEWKTQFRFLQARGASTHESFGSAMAIYNKQVVIGANGSEFSNGRGALFSYNL